VAIRLVALLAFGRGAADAGVSGAPDRSLLFALSGQNRKNMGYLIGWSQVGQLTRLCATECVWRCARCQTGLTRDYIGWSLYDKQIGYFNRPDVIHSPPPLSFPQFLGGGAYRKHVALLYKEQPGAWLTPVELFKPHYAHAVAQVQRISTSMRACMRVCACTVCVCVCMCLCGVCLHSVCVSVCTN
jgi:hypothetical protein